MLSVKGQVVVLRPELYRRLCQRASEFGFGTVRVANEGQEMMATVEHDALYDRPRLMVTWAGEYYVVNCPYCTDTRHRLWINHRWGLWDGRTRSRNLWLCCCYNEGCLEDYAHLRDLYNKVFDDITNGRRRFYDPVLRGERPSAPREGRPPGPEVYPLQTLEPDHTAVLYLRGRGFDPDRLGRALGVGFCPISYPEFRTAQARIIIPIFYNGTYVGWQARYPYHEAPPDGSPKYYTMPGMKKTLVLYNYDVAKAYPFVVLCEGCCDVWRVGPAAVGLFGKTMSATQEQLLTTTWGAGAAVVLLDGDAADEARRIYERLSGRVRHRVLVGLPDGKDPGGLDRDGLWRLIDTTARQQGVDLLAQGPGAQS
jgi:hypothetical protein